MRLRARTPRRGAKSNDTTKIDVTTSTMTGPVGRRASEALMSAPMDSRTLVIGTSQKRTGYVTIAIKDNGPGIEKKVMDHLFEPFYTTKQEGLGMGLAISRTIAEDHGGNLWAENNPDGGATLYFTVPVSQGVVA